MARIRIPTRARDRKKDLLETGRICLLGTTKITTNREIAEGRCGLGCVYPVSAAEIIKTLDRELLTVRGAHRRTGIGAAGSRASVTPTSGGLQSIVLCRSSTGSVRGSRAKPVRGAPKQPRAGLGPSRLGGDPRWWFCRRSGTDDRLLSSNRRAMARPDRPPRTMVCPQKHNNSSRVSAPAPELDRMKLGVHATLRQ